MLKKRDKKWRISQQRERSKSETLAFITNTFRRNFSWMPAEFASVRERRRRRLRNIERSLGICEARIRRLKLPRDVSSVDINIGRHATNRFVLARWLRETYVETGNRIRSIRTTESWHLQRKSGEFLCRAAFFSVVRSLCSFRRLAFPSLQLLFLSEIPFNGKTKCSVLQKNPNRFQDAS